MNEEEESSELRAVINAVTNTNKKIDDEYEKKQKRLEDKKKGFQIDETSQQKIMKLKEKYANLKSMISTVRREGKDPLIAELLLRNAPAKIKILESTLEKRDFDIVEDIFRKTEAELTESLKIEEVNIKKEIEKSSWKLKIYDKESRKYISKNNSISTYYQKKRCNLGLFGPKKTREDIIAEGVAASAIEEQAADKKDENFNSGNAKVDIEISKIEAQIEAFSEVRKANSERFARVSEQMGELRGMIMDSNKTMSKIEVSATKAIDLVESVQPEKLMIELRKQDGKLEGLRANLESNESMMKDIMEELKKMRQQMNFYKGIEQVAKLNDEVKTEIVNIKKVETNIERHANKAETIFLDLEKKYSESDKFVKKVDDIENTFHLIQEDFDKIKFQLTNKAEKKEFMGLMDKFNDFEKHTGDIIKLLDDRSKQSRNDLKDGFNKIKLELKKKHNINFEEQANELEEAKKLAVLQEMAEKKA